jgi:hypothetical protein
MVEVQKFMHLYDPEHKEQFNSGTCGNSWVSIAKALGKTGKYSLPLLILKLSYFVDFLY